MHGEGEEHHPAHREQLNPPKGCVEADKVYHRPADKGADEVACGEGAADKRLTLQKLALGQGMGDKANARRNVNCKADELKKLRKVYNGNVWRKHDNEALCRPHPPGEYEQLSVAHLIRKAAVQHHCGQLRHCGNKRCNAEACAVAADALHYLKQEGLGKAI